MSDDATPIRKITPKNVMKRIPNPPEKGSLPLYCVIGVAHGFVKGQKEFGGEMRPWLKLVGTFEATNYETGEVFTAPECFLPEPYNGMVAQKFQGDGEKPTAVAFGIEVGITQPGPGQNVKYVYTGKMLQAAGEADPLADLRKRVPALPAPAKKK